MNCPTCGFALGPQALFCGACGTPAVLDDSSAEDSLQSRNAAKQRRGRTAHAPEMTGVMSDTPAVVSRASFRGVMDSSHRKARKKMPVLVLMAILMFMFATVAWALYAVINPTVVNQREIGWTPRTVYAAMHSDRFDVLSILDKHLAITRMPYVRVDVPASIAQAEGDRLVFVADDEDENRVVIYFRKPSESGTRSAVQ